MTQSSKLKPLKQRARGVKPADPDERCIKVAAAIRRLEKIGATFTVADVADQSGLSRATIYRTQKLRELIGVKGDGCRLVDADLHEKLALKYEKSKTTARELRRQLADLEDRWEEMRERALFAETSLADAQRLIKLHETRARSTAQTSGSHLHVVAAKYSPDMVRRARRLLARALHPDLFTHDDAATAIATELLKAVNMLAE